jgi:ketosteroid isomerase-like protein
MKIPIILSILLLNLLGANAQNKDIAAITKILNQQVEQWNNGNLQGYMKGYWENDSLLFIGKSGPKFGFATTLANYQKGYPDTLAMGKLTSTILSIKKLAKNYYFITGKWYLTRSIGDLKGYYTLLFKKINNKWCIIVDHSS